MFAGPEPFQRRHPVSLPEITVNAGHGDRGLGQLPGDDIRLLFGPGEDQHPVGLGLIK